ncbi:MAG TPA: pilus assembly protein N-terminal domain-containing protein [Aliidiomarina sp.]|nr:pilus assembly protein N-terminal domain-containing protein [Aliidiomarina sp.]
MKYLMFLLFWVCGCFFATHGMTEHEIVQLTQGQSHLFSREQPISLEEEISRIAISNPDVVSVQMREHELVLFALTPGESKVHWWLENGQHREVNIVVYSEQRYMLEQFLELFTSDTEIHKRMNPATIWLSGRATAEEGERLLSLANSFSELDISQLEITDKEPQMVEMEIHVVELKRSYLKQNGLMWSPTAQGPALGLLSDWLGGRSFRLFNDMLEAWQPSVGELAEKSWSGLNGYLGLQTSLSSTLRLLEERGEARILATPRLRLESGEEANFLAGGELPIPQLNKDGAMDVTFHPYGIKIITAVDIQTNGFIRTQIEAELSRIDYAVAVQGVPGLLTRRSRSVVVLPARETVVLSGLKSTEMQTQRSGLPGHRNLWNILSGLASGHEDSRQDTELLVFITPRLVAEEDQRQHRRAQRTHHYRNHLSLAGCRGLTELDI